MLGHHILTLALVISGYSVNLLRSGVLVRPVVVAARARSAAAASRCFCRFYTFTTRLMFLLTCSSSRTTQSSPGGAGHMRQHTPVQHAWEGHMSRCAGVAGLQPKSHMRRRLSHGCIGAYIGCRS